MKGVEIPQVHVPEDEPGKCAEQQVFQGVERQIEPAGNGGENTQFFARPFRQIRGQANGTDPAAKTLAQKQAKKEGGQKDGEACRVDGVVFSGKKKPFQADQGPYGQKGLHRRWALDKMVGCPCRPEIKRIKLHPDDKAEDGKEGLADQAQDRDVFGFVGKKGFHGHGQVEFEQ